MLETSGRKIAERTHGMVVTTKMTVEADVTVEAEDGIDVKTEVTVMMEDIEKTEVENEMMEKKTEVAPDIVMMTGHSKETTILIQSENFAKTDTLFL